ncbi:MAG: efflux transporter outer membrane subunit [Burkholderiales bacterium]|nr:efflux transporter outer membrane subunit [Burkholderiales bacterium]
MTDSRAPRSSRRSPPSRPPGARAWPSIRVPSSNCRRPGPGRRPRWTGGGRCSATPSSPRSSRKRSRGISTCARRWRASTRRARTCASRARTSIPTSISLSIRAAGGTARRPRSARDRRSRRPRIRPDWRPPTSSTCGGRLASDRDAADRTLAATRYDAETVRISLAAEVATGYFTLRLADAELALSRATLATREDNVRLQRARHDAGLVSTFELRQAEAERASVAATIPPLEQAVALAQSALAVLAGRTPRAVFAPTVARGPDLEVFAGAPEVPPGLPSDLLARRPDIERAEAALAAAEFRIAEARAQYFPRVVLTGSLGSESARLADLFTGPAAIWAIAGSLVQPIVAAGRITAQVDAAKSRREQAEIAYVQAVQGAFRDVHDALVAHRSAREAFAAQENRRARVAETLKLAERRYRGGYSSYLEVLDAQRNLFSAERERLVALRNRQTALVSVYRALGGGWEPQALASTQ